MRPVRRCLITLLTGLALFAAPAAAPAAEPFTVESDVGYAPNGGGSLNQLDIYTPVASPAGPAPVVVYVHGGGWAIGDKANKIEDKARLFTNAGYVFVSVNYRLSPNPPAFDDPDRIRFPVHPDDVSTALGWLHREIGSRGGDPDRIALIGHSAGAHLVSLVGFDQARLRRFGVPPTAIRAVVPLDTDNFDIATDANPATSTQNQQAILSMWNAIATPAENAADGSWEKASPLGKGDRRDPPALFVTQAARPNRIAANEEMAADAGLDPATAVLGVPLNHPGINEALGDPADQTTETAAVSDFLGAAFATSRAPKAKLKRKPPKKIRTRSKRKRVRFRFTSSDSRASYRCRIDRKKWRSCSSPVSYRLKRGKHRFKVRAKTRDGLGKITRAKLRVVPR